MGSAAGPAELAAPFQAWVGAWEGEGRGLWEASPTFRYRERLLIEAVPGRAVLRLSQFTWALPGGEASHSESGFLRLLPGAEVELVLSAPSGYVEIHTGRLQGGVLELRPQLLGRSPTSRPLRLVERRLELSGDRLSSSLAIAVGPGPALPHVVAQLSRQARS